MCLHLEAQRAFVRPLFEQFTFGLKTAVFVVTEIASDAVGGILESLTEFRHVALFLVRAIRAALHPVA